MNPKQKLILRKLVEANGRKYSELFKYFSYEDKFPYHLKFLLNKKYISKRNSKYYLTKDGMRITSTFDRMSLEDVKLPQPMFIFICKFENKYLISKHFSDDKDISRHLYTLPSAKPLWGLPLEESCKKEFLRKNGVTADFKYVSTFHLINKTSDGDTLFDNIFLTFEAEIDEKEFANCKKDYWFTKEEISKLPNTTITVKKLLLENNRDPYIQDEVILNYGIEEFDL